MNERARRTRAGRFQPILLLLMCAAVLWVGGVGMAEARRSSVSLPLFFDTPYLAARSIISIAFLAFFLVLMGRHVLLLVFSVLDQIDRATAEARERRSAVPFEPLVSIVAPAFNEEKVIEASIRSLLEQDYPQFEVLVVDDGSTDDTLARARTLEGQHPNARVEVLWQPNAGKAAALNFGIARAAGDFVLCVDSDSALAPGTLRAAVRHFRDPSVGAVAGSVDVGDVTTLWSKLQFLEYVKGLNLVRRAQGFIRAVSIVPGPVGLFRKSAIEAVGGFSNDTFAEDCELTLRLLMDGWKVSYEPLASARTEAPDALIPLIKQRYRWTRGILQAIRKHRSTLLRPRGSVLATIMLWYLVFEALVWPVMTCVTVGFLLAATVDTAVRPAALYFWAMLVALDTATTLYCLAIDGKNVLYAVLAPIERMVFTIVLDVCRGLASIEELFGIEMSWGKLERRGAS